MSDIIYQSKGALVAFLEEAGFQTGSSDVQASGTPLNNELAVWTDASTIEGASAITYNNGYLTVDPDSNVYATLGKTTDTNTEFARLRLRANKNGNAVNAWIDARDSATRSGLQLGTVSDHAIYFYQNDGIVMQINDNRNVEITASIRGSYASSANDANLVIHNAWDAGGRISFTNTADTSGPYGNSWDWTIYGDPAAEASPASADLHFFYGDADGDGTGANILTIQGDKKVGINDSSPSYPLDVNGNIRTTGYVYQEVYSWGSSLGYYTQYYVAGNSLYQITSTRKVKGNIKTYDELGLPEVLKLRTVSYIHKTNPSTWPEEMPLPPTGGIGFIAEEAYDVHPKFTTMGPDYDYDENGQRKKEEYINEDGKTEKRYVLLSDEIVPDATDDRSFIIALVNSVKELKAENDSLLARVEALENKG